MKAITDMGLRVNYQTAFAVVMTIVSACAPAFGSSGIVTSHYEAEAASLRSGARKATENFPYVGDGYVVLPQEGAAISWSDLRVPSAGYYTLIIKYANAWGEDRPCALRINGRGAGQVSFASVYDDECYYWNARFTARLEVGPNTIELVATTPAGGPNVDNLAVSSAGSVAPPGKQFDVRRYGARGDGLANDTAAIQAAIDACERGGSVVLRDGVFMSGMIRLKSDMTFWLDRTATLRAIQDENQFPNTNPPTPNVSVADELGKAFIYSEGSRNVTIAGGGVVDGNAECEIWDATKDESVRPVPIYLTQGVNLVVRDIDIVRGAMWNVVPLECDDVFIDGLNIDSTFGMNKDGIDPCDCHRVLVTNCVLTLEDDALCPKSGHPRGCEDITFRNITVNRTICGLVKLGTKTYGYFKNIVFEDLSLYGARAHKDSNVGINLSTVDGAEIDGVIVRRVNMRNAATAVFIMHGGGAKRRSPVGLPDKAGDYLRNILIEDIDARECHDPFGNFITGTQVEDGKVHRVSDVTLRRVRVQCPGGVSKIPSEPVEYTGQYPNYDWPGSNLPAWGYYVRYADRIRFEDCEAKLLSADARPKLVTIDATVFFDRKAP